MKPERSSVIYSLDSDALINIQMCYPKAIKVVSRHARDGRVVVPEGVYRELCRKTDRLKNTVQTWKRKHSAVVSLDSAKLQTELARIESAYGKQIVVGDKVRGGFWASRSGKLSADGQVVTICKVNNYIAVSNDRAVQDACHIENVPCIGWQEFYRRMSQRFAGQAALFD